MVHKSISRLVCVCLLTVVFGAPSSISAQDASPVAGDTAGVEVVVNGLTNPRGFTWGADGELYLALAGVGGETQVSFEGTPAPFFSGKTSSIATVVHGCAVPMAEGLPSGFWSDAGWVWGVMDLAILDGELYALSGGGSESWGQPESPNGIYRVQDDGTWELVADLGAWMQANPTAFIPPDYDPNGSWFDLEAGEDRLWVSEAVGGMLLTVLPGGEIELAADLSEGHLVPTGVALDGEGGAYVGFETVAPYVDGSSKVVHVAADGTVTVHWTGLTAVTDVIMGPEGSLYAAEMATGNLDEEPFLNPGSGRIVRQTGPDSLEQVITDIEAPVYMAFDPDGDLYLTYPAYAPDAGEGHGSLLSIDLTPIGPISLADLDVSEPTCAG